MDCETSRWQGSNVESAEAQKPKYETEKVEPNAELCTQ